MSTRPFLEQKRRNEALLLQEIREKRTTLTARPPRCTFEHSWRCNYRCKKCAYSSLTRGETFSAAQLAEWAPDDLRRLAEELFPTMTYVESTLLGEPFLSPQFKALMGLCRDYGVYYRPTTNASLLTEEVFPHINGVVDWLKCSFDAHTPELYQRLYLNNQFTRVVKNLKAFSAARRQMTPYPWFRVGLVMMRSNLLSLREYADFVFGELGVDDMEVMALNYSNDEMLDEFYWDIPDVVNREIDALANHAVTHGYRVRLPFFRMPRQDGSWIDGETSAVVAARFADNQPVASPRTDVAYSEEVLRGDIFGNREQLERGYVWSNDMRTSRITATDGSPIGVCEYFTRPFFKPPTTEADGRSWIKYESCGSCSTFVFGNLKQATFGELYNNAMNTRVREFMYNKPQLPRDEWMLPCKNCLCVDQVYLYDSNGQPNVGVRVFDEAGLYGEHRRLAQFAAIAGDRAIVVWGTGSAAARALDEFPGTVAFCVDNNSALWGTSFRGLSVRSPHALAESPAGSILLLVASHAYQAIAEQLRGMGFVEHRDFWYVGAPLA